MPAKPFKAKAYLKSDCPYSFKFLLFMTEAGLREQLEIVRCDPREAQFGQVKAQLADATGANVTFPTVEIEPGVYKSDSGKLIEYYAGKNSVSAESLPAFSFYSEGIFPQLVQLHE